MAGVPLRLWNRPHWELRGQPDGDLFFRRLGAALPAATTLFVEGSGIAAEVETLLRSSAEPGEYLPPRQALLPRPKQFRVRCDAPTLMALADLAEAHAEQALLDHLFVYGGPAVLLEYPDAFGRKCPIYISSDVEEERARESGLEIVNFRDLPLMARAVWLHE